MKVMFENNVIYSYCNPPEMKYDFSLKTSRAANSIATNFFNETNFNKRYQTNSNEVILNL